MSRTNEYELAIKIAGMVEKSLNTAVDKAGNELDSLQKKAQLASGAFKAIGVGILGLGATLGLGASSFANYDEAYRQMIASTGAGTEKAKELKEVLEGVYSDNFGESWDDVANSIAFVNQNMDGTKEQIKQTTEDALAFRDTFGYEVNESVRSAKSLMDQFGVSSREAYTLMAQGAQNGLDYSGELLDSINEYSVQFAKFGFNAEDMFNIFSSGAENGAFNLDKVGDAVKEFSIRAIDGSKTTNEGFTKLGMNVEEMASKFAKGGDSAKEAFYDTIEAISKINDPVEQSLIGVDLFGTMWEDLGPDVVTQLASIRNGFNKTKDTIDDINEIKYTSFSSALTGIGRQIETAFIPIGEALVPLLNSFANWMKNVGAPAIKSFSDKIKAAITGVPTPEILAIKNIVSSLFQYINTHGPQILSMLKNLIPIVAGVVAGFAAFKAILFFTKLSASIMKVVGIVKNVIFAFQAFAGGAATLGEAVALVCNPIGLVVAAIGAFIAIIVALYMKNQEFRNKVNEAWGTIKATVMEVISNIQAKIAEHQGTINAVVGFIQNVVYPVIVSILEAVVTYVGNSIAALGTIINGIIDVIFGVIDIIVGICNGDWAGVWDGIKEVVQGAIDIIKGLWQGLVELLSSPINAVVNLTKKVFGGDDDNGQETVKVGHNAKGTNNWRGGLTYINEGNKGELINLPNGTQITSHAETESLFSKIANANAQNNSSTIAKLVGTLSGGANKSNNRTINNDENPMKIEFCPVLNFNSGTPNKNDIVEAMEMTQEKFNNFMKNWQKQNGRVGFARG